MEDNNIQNQVNDINKKLDVILEEIELQRKHRSEIEDMKEDLTRVGKDLFKSAIIELDEVQDNLETGDILHLLKKLLRNVKNISKTFDQLENIKNFVEDASPLSRDIFIDFMRRLDEFDRKGYFYFMKELSKVGDKVVTSFTVEDVKSLGDNIVTILNTVKNLTQPDVLESIDSAVMVYKKLGIEVTEKVSYISLLKEFNTPEMKKGLAFGIRFLKSLAESPGTKNIAKLKTVYTN